MNQTVNEMALGRGGSEVKEVADNSYVKEGSKTRHEDQFAVITRLQR